MILVLTVFGVVLSMTFPQFRRIRQSAAARSARFQVTAAIGLARSSAVRWGETAVLDIDTVQDELTVWVDTTSGPQIGDSLVVQRIPLRQLDVAIETTNPSLCFSPRGFGTTSAECASTGAEITLRHGTDVETVRVNSVGRIW